VIIEQGSKRLRLHSERTDTDCSDNVFIGPITLDHQHHAFSRSLPTLTCTFRSPSTARSTTPTAATPSWWNSRLTKA